jgi:hypothetical protein
MSIFVALKLILPEVMRKTLSICFFHCPLSLKGQKVRKSVIFIFQLSKVRYDIQLTSSFCYFCEPKRYAIEKGGDMQ